MKYVINFLKGLIFSAWLLIAIFTTVCLISYNEYKVSVFGRTSLFVVDSDELEPTFMENDIIISTREKQTKYNEGDFVFYYKKNVDVNYIQYGQIKEANHSEGAISSFRINDQIVSYDDLIGTANGAKKYAKAGLVLRLFASRWGYMFLVILPTLFLLVYEIYAIVVEVKKEVRREKKRQAKKEEEDKKDVELPSLKN